MSPGVKDREFDRKYSTVQPKESVLYTDSPHPRIMVGLWYNWTIGSWIVDVAAGKREFNNKLCALV